MSAETDQAAPEAADGISLGTVNIDLNAPIFASFERSGRILTDAAIRGEPEPIEAAPESASGVTLDQLADETLTRVAAFIGECAGGDTFCGFGVDETRDENGLLLSFRLVPCDTIDGEAVRRVAR